MIKIDFTSSAKRHYQDALLLVQNNRAANAGQLYGFCAECGIKALMISLGYSTDPEGSPVRNPPSGEHIRKHINELLGIKTQIDVFISGRNGAKYLAKIPSIHCFSDWSVHHRYYDQNLIPSSLQAWEQAAIEIRTMMDEASTDGVL